MKELTKATREKPFKCWTTWYVTVLIIIIYLCSPGMASKIGPSDFTRINGEKWRKKYQKWTMNGDEKRYDEVRFF